MGRRLTQRELRNESGKIMRALDRGEEFIVTRNGVPVGELIPMRRRFVASRSIVEIFRGSPRVDLDHLRRDLDRQTDQDIAPRG